MLPDRLAPAFLVLILPLAACQAPANPAGRVPAADRLSTANELDASGKPYNGPDGPVSSFPPADNTDPRLHCHPEGIGVRCDRDSSP